MQEIITQPKCERADVGGEACLEPIDESVNTGFGSFSTEYILRKQEEDEAFVLACVDPTAWVSDYLKTCGIKLCRSNSTLHLGLVF